MIQRSKVRRVLASVCFALAMLIAALTVFTSVAIDVGPRGPLKGFTQLIDLTGGLLTFFVGGCGARLWRRPRVDPTIFD
jgi:hypothetical protein